VDGYVQNSICLSVIGVCFTGRWSDWEGSLWHQGLFAKIVSVAIPLGGIELLFHTNH
jgi:hypothetical protein